MQPPAARKAAAALPLVCAGCSTLLTAVPPQVEIRDVSLRAAGFLDQALAVQLCVTNPNAAALDFRAVKVGLELEGSPFAEGTSEAAVLLPPRSSTLVPFQVATTERNLAPQLLGVLRSGNVRYRLHGTVTLAGALALELPFSKSGRLDLLSGSAGALTYAASPETTRCGPSPQPPPAPGS